MSIRAAAAAAAFALLAVSCSSAPSAKERERAEIHYNLGVEALRANRLQEALKEFDEALSGDEAFADAHLGRGLVLEYGYSRLDDAEKEYRRAIELRPSYSEAHNNLGQLLAKRGRLPEAVAEFDAALENMLYKEPYVARCNKGEALNRLGRRDEGVAELKLCLQSNPSYCFGYRTLGLVRMDEGNGAAAVDAFEKYSQHCPQSADAWLQLGLANLRAGNAQKARDAFEKCESAGKLGDVADECRRRRAVLQ
ncbi:MAG TPA: tetratricopeptide repeat protein [Anaeromyxobacteraceae bacterium]|nr:tetratricopeptide repeat protein [Anaeromyxobacteraceae bacterium]